MVLALSALPGIVPRAPTKLAVQTCIPATAMVTAAPTTITVLTIATTTAVTTVPATVVVVVVTTVTKVAATLVAVVALATVVGVAVVVAGDIVDGGSTRMKLMLEICPRGNNKMIIIIFPCS